MATDLFTNTNGTGLESHDAKWTSIGGSYVVTTLEIQSNTVRADGEEVVFGAYYSNSQPASPQISEIIFKAQSAAGGDGSKAVCVRAASSSGNIGYSLILSSPSGVNYTAVVIEKNGSWLATLAESQTIPYGSDHLMKITATGTSTTILRGYVDGQFIGDDISDSSSPYTTGYPGFAGVSSTTISDSAFDEWTDYQVNSNQEILYPNADGATVNWADWSGTPHWSCLDEIYGIENNTDGIIAASVETEMLAFANPAVMGASDTCTQIEMLAACSLFTGTESYDCYYSTDGGSSWSSATSVSVTSVDPKYRWVKATFSGLALTQTQVNALQVKMTRTGSGGGTACTSLCAIITFSAEFIPRPQHQKPLAILRM